MSVASDEPKARRRHRAAGLVVGAIAVVTALVAGVLVAAAVNPGYERHWYFLEGALPVALVAGGVAFAAARLLGWRSAAATGVAAVLVCGSIGAVFGLGFAAQPDKAADEAQNLAFLRTIARPPGSILVGTRTSRRYPDGDMFAEGFLNPSPGYATGQTFLLRRGATLESAVAFYREELERHGWTVEVFADCTGWAPTDPGCGRSLWANRDTEFVTGVFVYRRADGRIVASI